MSGSVISVRKLTARFGTATVLDDVSVEIRPGEILVVMGGSGSGKSTLLRHLLGLRRPDGGNIDVLGQSVCQGDWHRWLDVRRRMGVAFQSGALLSSLSVGDNLMLPLREHTRLCETTMRIMVRLKLDFVNLPGCENLMPAELSGGMIKRVALARAIMLDPRILFLDEPSAGLDPVVSAALDELLMQYRDASGASIIVVTHELDSAFKIADRICVLDRGQVIAMGSVDEVRASEHPRVQALIQRRVERVYVTPEAYLDQITGHSEVRRVN